MISKIKKFLQSHTQAQTPEQQQHHLNIAAASMLCEVIFADEQVSDEEANLLPSLLVSLLGLAEQQAQELSEEAKLSRQNATSLFEFTNEINDKFTLEQKQQLILAMWKLAYADGRLCQYEDQIVRRCADLLYLKHSELIQLRNQARDSLGV
ncbi:TerB family tellurite resistance protein [Shewanella sp. NIFS-20-20]|uniref:tellurite resistance TerB family protein n=1 Tax=Shewanella sp. NIFS-20-20 TaxID=2853806 RepID=UPI001C43D96A|nr:TerB family tellurite resistance protein [Shewanella sp. NIFS-20-20]MBV7316676.1 TerB family tellurite resistance protein [Shewanella sp. NIFS-20-20]